MPWRWKHGLDLKLGLGYGTYPAREQAQIIGKFVLDVLACSPQRPDAWVFRSDEEEPTLIAHHVYPLTEPELDTIFRCMCGRGWSGVITYDIFNWETEEEWYDVLIC